MKYLLDTDHLSILQCQAEQDYINLSTRIAHYPLSDFAISTVTLRDLRDKMKEYMDNDVQLGWLLNPTNKEVEIYRVGKEPQVLRAANELSGEEVLPGFVLTLQEIWN